MAHLTEEEKSNVLGNPEQYRYQLLSRLKADCDYWLGNGNKADKWLWASEGPAKQIAYMRELWESFPEDEKPEWLSLAEVNEYAVRMGVSVRAVLLPVGKAPQDIVIDFDDSTEQLQGAVGGLIEYIPVLGDKGIDLWVNEEGLLLHLSPNQALYATDEMEQSGYLGQSSADDSPVKEGDLYSVLVGDAVACSFDSEGTISSMDDKQIDFIKQEFADPNSGRDAVTAFQVLRDIGLTRAPNRTDVERIAEINAEMAAYAVEDLADSPSELDRHPELTEDEQGLSSGDPHSSLQGKASEAKEGSAKLSEAELSELPFSDKAQPGGHDEI